MIALHYEHINNKYIMFFFFSQDLKDKVYDIDSVTKVEELVCNFVDNNSDIRIKNECIALLSSQKSSDN